MFMASLPAAKSISIYPVMAGHDEHGRQPLFIRPPLSPVEPSFQGENAAYFGRRRMTQAIFRDLIHY
jgi:hypothetical protein